MYPYHFDRHIRFSVMVVCVARIDTGDEFLTSFLSEIRRLSVWTGCLMLLHSWKWVKSDCSHSSTRLTIYFLRSINERCSGSGSVLRHVRFGMSRLERALYNGSCPIVILQQSPSWPGHSSLIGSPIEWWPRRSQWLSFGVGLTFLMMGRIE